MSAVLSVPNYQCTPFPISSVPNALRCCCPSFPSYSIPGVFYSSSPPFLEFHIPPLPAQIPWDSSQQVSFLSSPHLQVRDLSLSSSSYPQELLLQQHLGAATSEAPQGHLRLSPRALSSGTSHCLGHPMVIAMSWSSHGHLLVMTITCPQSSQHLMVTSIYCHLC